MVTDFGEYLKRLRENKNMTLEELSEASGVSISQISRIESGKRGIPKPPTIKNLSSALNVSYTEMMVVAGYWGEEDLLSPINYNEQKNYSSAVRETPSQYNAEKEFVKKIDLSDEEIMKQFKVVVDGRELTDREWKKLVAFVRMERDLE